MSRLVDVNVDLSQEPEPWPVIEPPDLDTEPEPWTPAQLAAALGDDYDDDLPF